MPYTVVSGDTLGAIAARLGVADWRDLIINGQPAGETDPRALQVGATIMTPEEHTADQDAGAEAPAQEGTQQEQPTGDPGQNPNAFNQGGDPETTLNILEGQDMTWGRDPQTGKWYVKYKMPNSNLWSLFEVEEDQMDAIFGTGVRPWGYEGGSLETQLAREDVMFAGNVGLVEGEGSFDEAINRVTALALDDGQLPAWAAESAEAMDLLYLAQSQGKSNDWLLDQLIKLPSFRQRFPGLEKFKTAEGLTTEDAVTAFLEFESGVKKALDAHGFNGDAMHPTMVGALIDNNYNLNTVVDAIGTFKRMQDFAPAMEAFNQILVSKGLDPLTDQASLFQFMRGESPVEYYETYEASSIQEAANLAGLGDVFTAEDAVSAALQGEFDRQTASEGFQGASRLLLRLRNEVDLGKYNLEQGDLIDISLGLAPSSGRTMAEVEENISRAVEESRGYLERRARPFTGFTQTGTPQAASLKNLGQTS